MGTYCKTLIIMLNVGEKLKNNRLSRKYDVSFVSQSFSNLKIPERDEKKEEEKEELLKHISSNIIGNNMDISTPFGIKPMLYLDYTASGRSVTFLEQFISNEVLPYYANTHTSISHSARQTTFFRHEAREYILRQCNGGEDDVLIFSGSGATGAANKLRSALNLEMRNQKVENKTKIGPREGYGRFDETIEENDDIYLLDGEKEEDLDTIVIVGPFAHHSNILPWRESKAIVATVKLNEEGGVDFNHLEELLQKYRNKKMKIGTFTKTSNVTGMKNNNKKK